MARGLRFPDRPKEEAPVAVTARRILVVEDEPLVRNLLEAALGLRGHAVELVPDGPSALDRIERGRYDLVITDLLMPGMTGLELIEAIRRRPGRLPVILMSSLSPQELPVPGMLPPGVDFLRKPFGLAELDAAVKRATDARPGAP